MLLSYASCLLALTAVVVAAAPTEKRWFGNSRWKPQSSSSYPDFGKRVPGPSSNAPLCDLSQASPPIAPTPLPPPAPGLTLSHVAIGRGTQNYTCDLTNATAVPVAIGANATLFNVSCIAASSALLLSELPIIALDLPIPATIDPTSPIYQDLSGYHYFTDATTPYFDLNTPLHQYGCGAFRKVNASAAPAGADKGQYGRGNGSVPWLKLDAKTEDGQVFQEVYRLATAGGQPPASCVGMPAAFEVPYSAEYWLYA